MRDQQGDLRHEAEAGVDSQSVSFTHTGGINESFLSCGVVSGLVIPLLLEEEKKRAMSAYISVSFLLLPNKNPLKLSERTVLVSTMVRMSPLWYNSSPGLGFL